MPTELVVSGGALASADGYDDALRSAGRYALREKAESTLSAYRADFADFVAWCGVACVAAVPASAGTVAAYLASLADAKKSVSTIQRRAAAIAHAHKLAGEPSPLGHESVRAVMRGIRRTLGVAVRAKAPATAEIVARMIRKIPDDLAGRRDRAMILLGFAAALRRSELVALDVSDLEMNADGLILHIRRSKTDQEGAGAEIAIPRGKKLRVLEAVEAWLLQSKLTEGALFRRAFGGGVLGERLTDQSVALIVKKRAKAARIDPSAFSGHSLRAGFVTSALAGGADVLKVMDVTRHREVKTLKAYDRRAKAFKDHAGKGFL